MKKFKGKYERILEQTLYRYQQGGFLRGDYVRIKDNALNHPIVKQMSGPLKEIIENAKKSDTYYRVSYIKSGHSEAFNGPVDAANIPSETLWADIIHEYAPGMWKDPLTLPLEVLEKVEVEGASGYAQYPDSIKRDTDFSGDEADEVDQTMGKDENRKLHNKNKKLEHAQEPRSGMKDTKPLKDSVQVPRRENDFIFEQYTKSKV